MDLNLTPDQQAFRADVRGWLAEHVPAQPLPPLDAPDGITRRREWERTLFDAGFAAISWPKAYGGRDADLLTQAIFAEEYARAVAPERLNPLGLGLAGPTIIAFGTPEQKEQWLPSLLRGDDIWCQGFSEPDAGSDLAALKTSAVLEGDEYVINGQKIWTSLGRWADWMFCLVRTDKDAPKHKGITYIMIDMSTPGIEVRPITQINGDPGFAEVFFTDVRVPAVNVIGEPNEGWRIAMATLGFERGTGLGSHVRFSRDLAQLIDIVKAVGLAGDPLVRDEIGKLYAETEVFRYNTYRTLSRLTSGKPLGPEASLTKLYWSQMETRIYEAGMQAAGEFAELSADAPAIATQLGDAAGLWKHWQKQYLYARGAMIYAGTSEIQKNIISELVLGLPKEPRG
jgi:alkylation response protein AidB-like acyl-CoA dehydrogenase